MYKIIGGDGKEYGPVSAEQLRQWFAEGRVNAQTKVLAEDSTEWRTLAAIGEFAGLVGVPPVTPPVTPSARPYQVTFDIPTYLAPAILVTLFCCLPFGIPAIVFAAQVNSKRAAGDIEGAKESSQKAKTWCWVSFFCWLAMVAIYLLVFALVGFNRSVGHHF